MSDLDGFLCMVLSAYLNSMHASCKPWILIFHKVVQRHSCGVVGSLKISLLQIYSLIHAVSSV